MSTPLNKPDQRTQRGFDAQALLSCFTTWSSHELTSNAVMLDHSEPADPFTFVVSLPRIRINTGAAQDPKKIALSFTTIEIIEEFQP